MSWLLQRWQSLVSLFTQPRATLVAARGAAPRGRTAHHSPEERLRTLEQSLRSYQQQIQRLDRGIAAHYDATVLKRGSTDQWLAQQIALGRYTGFHRLAREAGQLAVQVREAVADQETAGLDHPLIRQLRELLAEVTAGINRIRVLPFVEAVDTLPAAMRTLAYSLGKVIDVHIEGQDVLVAREVLGELTAMLEHLTAFALTASIETPSARSRAGKPPRGRLTVRCSQSSSDLEIEVRDDGAGLNYEQIRRRGLVKGFLAVREVDSIDPTELFARAVAWGATCQPQVAEGFHRRLERLGARLSVEVLSGQGLVVRLSLACSLVRSQVLVFRLGSAQIALPRPAIEEVVSPELLPVIGDGPIRHVSWRGRQVRYFDLAELIDTPTAGRPGAVVVLQEGGRFMAVAVSALQDARPTVVRHCNAPSDAPAVVGGTVVLAGGRSVPLLRVEALFARLAERAAQMPPPRPSVVPTVLVIDDSLTARDLLSLVLLRAGYRVQQARDGQEAIELLRSGLDCNLIFCDIHMPRLSGLEFLAALADDAAWNQVPVAMLTARVDAEEIRTAYELGARAYFTKPFNDDEILQGVQRLCFAAPSASVA